MLLPASEIKNIAIFRALQLGDLLCSVPSWRMLRANYPSAKIHLIGLSGMKELVDRYPAYIDEFINFPGYPGLPEQPFDQHQFDIFLTKMHSHQFDLLIQQQGNGGIVNELLGKFGAKYLAGFCVLPEEQTELFLHYPNQGHEILRHLKLMEHLGLTGAENHTLEFQFKKEDETEVRNLGLSLKAKTYVCIHPGSRGSWRQWPIAYFANVANYCASLGYQIIVTGTKSELNLAQELASLCKYPIEIAAGRTSLGALAALLKNAKLLVANCTGSSHLAAALQTPSVIISMDGEPKRWAPLNKKIHRTIDWTIDKEYQLVLEQVKQLLNYNQLF